jgi:hypothetical protein
MNNQNIVISFNSLRKAIGVLGIVLPIALLVLHPLLYSCNSLQPSISDFYHTNMRNLFVGVMCAVGFFLFCYNGYDKRDYIAARIAAFAAVGVAFSPTYIKKTAQCVTNIVQSAPIENTMHNVFAVIFFLSLFYFSWFLFPLHSNTPTKEKLVRNKIYKTCAVIILVCIILIALIDLIPDWRVALQAYKPTFWLEAIALWAFGTSWLTKGEAMFADK